MRRHNIEEAAQIVRESKTTAGKMDFDDLDELLKILQSGQTISAILKAYDAGYYRGALATARGQFQPGKGARK